MTRLSNSAGVQFKILAPALGSVAFAVVIGTVVLEWSLRQLRDEVIPEECDKERIDPMFNIKAFGVGLGLPITKKALDKHAGGLEIHSDFGAGSQIAIWLPLTETAREQPM